MTEKQDRFSHAMEQCRQAYRDIPTPPELEGAVEDAIQAGCRPRLPRRGLKRAAAAAAGLCACFVVLTSPAVAAAVDDVPVLGQLCRILTGQAYESREETSYVQVQLPQIENTGDSSLEQRVNLEISAVLSREVDESKERAREYYQAYLDTGGDPDTFQPIQIKVDYQVKSVTEESGQRLLPAVLLQPGPGDRPEFDPAGCSGSQLGRPGCGSRGRAAVPVGPGAEGPAL